MSDPCGGTQQPPLENDEYAPDEIDLPPAANRLLQPRHSFFAPLVIVIIAFGVVASLTAIGISRLGPIDQMRPTLGSETPPSPQPDRFSEQTVEPAEAFKSLVLDATQSYLASTNANAQTEIDKLRGCLVIVDGSQERNAMIVSSHPIRNQNRQLRRWSTIANS
jgi:hypothetical protein